MSSASTEYRTDGSSAAAISNLVVRLMSEYTGRGPTKARTYLNDDLITVVLQDTLTRGERSLVRDGKEELVLSTRFAFQQTMSGDMIGGVEQITGRKVRAFMSSNHMDPDMAIESFVMESRNGDGPQPAATDELRTDPDQSGFSTET
jgi:uncharacterized protein YbcI